MLLRIHHEAADLHRVFYEAVLEVRMAPSSDQDQTNLGYRLQATPAIPGTLSPPCPRLPGGSRRLTTRSKAVSPAMDGRVGFRQQQSQQQQGRSGN